jgi:GNAT superfamily N-acetyltransferase
MNITPTSGKTVIPPHILKSFTSEIVARELKGANNALFIIYYGDKVAGTVKLIKSSPLLGFPRGSAMLLDKIYLLREFAGKGIGGIALSRIELLGRKLNKSVIWLYSMQQGPALAFYLRHGFVIREEKQLDYPEVLDEHRLMYLLTKSLRPASGPDDA